MTQVGVGGWLHPRSTHDNSEHWQKNKEEGISEKGIKLIGADAKAQMI
jgi:hypothetical protein